MRRVSPPGRAALRGGFYVAVLALALIRLRLYPPVDPPLVLVLATWFATAALYFALRPRQADAGCLAGALDFAFYVYEVSAVLAVSHYLGATGWLAILLLLYPVMEINVRYPGRPGVIASVIAILGCTAMAAVEAVGRLGHDPFYSVGDPLYRQPEYLLAVLIVATFTLLAPAALQARSRS